MSRKAKRRAVLASLGAVLAYSCLCVLGVNAFRPFFVEPDGLAFLAGFLILWIVLFCLIAVGKHLFRIRNCLREARLPPTIVFNTASRTCVFPRLSDEPVPYDRVTICSLKTVQKVIYLEDSRTRTGKFWYNGIYAVVDAGTNAGFAVVIDQGMTNWSMRRFLASYASHGLPEVVDLGNHEISQDRRGTPKPDN
ncbi:MAG: hypothetical protein SFY96_05450 [Planctomycetota bacterium]|nr:hypothetical protein [Planctomycetota bacterium]